MVKYLQRVKQTVHRVQVLSTGIIERFLQNHETAIPEFVSQMQTKYGDRRGMRVDAWQMRLGI